MFRPDFAAAILSLPAGAPARLARETGLDQADISRIKTYARLFADARVVRLLTQLGLPVEADALAALRAAAGGR